MRWFKVLFGGDDDEKMSKLIYIGVVNIFDRIRWNWL